MKLAIIILDLAAMLGVFMLIPVFYWADDNGHKKTEWACYGFLLAILPLAYVSMRVLGAP